MFGRTRTTKTADGKVHIQTLPREQWQVIVRDAHVGYISWEEYEAHLSQLATNSQAYTPQRLNPPREGPALLQGLVICGVCGERMTVRYHQRSGHRIVPDYLCQRDSIARGTAPCQRFLGRDLDQAVAKLLLEVVTPEAIAQTLAIQDELLGRLDDAERLRQWAIQRAQYEADVAQRRFVRVDPDNRLVADVLEAEWNTKLRMLAEAREVAQQQRQQDQTRLDILERKAMLELPQGLAQVWKDAQITDRDRKRIVRLLIEDVTVHKADCITAHIRFKGGATHTLTIALPPPFAHSRLTSSETLAVLDELLHSFTDAEVAEQLNAQGYRTFVGLPFEATHVSQLRRKHGLKDRYTRLREAGLLTAEEVAAKLGVQAQTIWRWYHAGDIKGIPYNDRGTCLFFLPEARPKYRRRNDECV